MCASAAAGPFFSQPSTLCSLSHWPLVLSAVDAVLSQPLAPCSLCTVWCSPGVNQTQVPEHRHGAVLHLFTKPGLSVQLQETNCGNFQERASNLPEALCLMGPLLASLYGRVVVFRILVLGWCTTAPGCLYIKGHASAFGWLGICSCIWAF